MRDSEVGSVAATSQYTSASTPATASSNNLEDTEIQIALLPTQSQQLEAVVKELRRLPPDQDKQLLKDCLSRTDKGFFSAVHLAELKSNRRINDEDLTALADTVAALYADKKLTASQIDMFLSPMPAGQATLGPAYKNGKAALEGATEFFASSNSAEFQRFTEQYTADTLTQLAHGPNGTYPQDRATTVLAALAGAGKSDVFLDAYAGQTAQARKQILTGLAEGATRYVLFGKNADVPADGFATLMTAVANKPPAGTVTYVQGHPAGVTNAKWDDLAVQMVRFAAENRQYFADGPIGGTRTPIKTHADALGALFVSHERAILDAYTDAYKTGKPGDVQVLSDTYILANLLSLTADNPKSAYASSINADINTYSKNLGAALNGPQQSAIDAVDRLAVLYPARLLAAGVSGLDTLDGKQALANTISSAINIGASFGLAYAELPAALIEVMPTLKGSFDVAKGMGGQAGADYFREKVYQALVGAAPAQLEKAVQATADVLIADTKQLTSNPLVAESLKNSVHLETDLVADAIRSRDFSRFQNAVKHDGH